MLNTLIHNIPFLFGVSLVAAAVGGRTALFTGIALIALGLYFK